MVVPRQRTDATANRPARASARSSMLASPRAWRGARARDVETAAVVANLERQVRADGRQTDRHRRASAWRTAFVTASCAMR
jgi:hypothetical protein